MKNILFVGNSFTYYNNLPLMVQTLAQNAGVQINCDSRTRPGAALHDYAIITGKNENDIGGWLRDNYKNQFEGQAWDCVVLQDQSLNPVKDKEDMLRSSEKLCSEVFVHGESVFFYQTWPYKVGSERYKNENYSYEDIYIGLKEAYSEAAKKLNGKVVPVGDGFYLAAKKYPEVELYASDGAHPSATGTYLSACIFVSVLYNIDPMELSDIDGLNPEEADKMRIAAADLTYSHG
jgi:hypothetical protein